MTRIGVITGLAREADCFGSMRDRQALRICCAGGDAKRAVACARKLVSDGCRGLVSFGIAGGLNPSLAPGSVVVAAAVVADDRSRIPCDVGWQGRLTAVLETEMSVVEAELLGRDQPVLLSAEKRRLHDATGAAAVDMESLAIGCVAVETEVPFLAVRAIADPADRDLPAWVPGLVDRDGRPRMRAVIRQIATHPRQAAVLFRLGMESRKAFGALGRVALASGPFFQFRA